MKKMRLNEGVAHAAENIREGKGTKPFTALIGAGVSVSAGIPLGRGLIEQAHAKFPSVCHGIAKTDPRCYWLTMRALDPEQRRQLIIPYIDNAKLNWANIALAQLLASAYLGRVLTVNFDPLLAKASGLLGHYPAIYDFGAAPVSNVANMAEPCIVHLHGQSTGFVLLNTDKETQDHADRLKPLIQHVLQRAPLIVIGYSGQADALLQTITTHYSGSRLYWVDLSDDAPSAVATFIDQHDYTHFIGGADADRFLVALCNKLKCFPPKIFNDPVGHLLDEMAPVADFPKGTGDQSIDILTGWRKDMAELRADHLGKHGTRRNVESLVIQGKTSEAAELARQGPAGDEGLSDLADELGYWEEIERANEAGDAAKQFTGPKATELFEEAAAGYERATQKSKIPHEALNNWGNALGNWARIETDPAAQAARFHDACDTYARAIAIKPDKHEALNNWGIALIYWAKTETNPVAKAARLEEAENVLKRALALASGETYDLACLASLRGNGPACWDYLLTALDAGNLPTRQHLEADPDLANVRNEPWFPDILAKAKV